MPVLRYHITKLHGSRESSARLERTSEETGRFGVHYPRVHVPKSVWETAIQTKRGDSVEKKARMLRTIKTSFFEAPFELPKDYVKQAKLKEKRASQANVLTVVEESETAHLQSHNSDSEHNTDLEDDEMGDVVDGCGSDGNGDGGWEEPKQEKKKRRAKAKKRSKKAGSIEDTIRESESKQPQNIKDIRNQKLHERMMDGSGTTSDPLKLLQNFSPCLEQVCSTLQDVQRELLLPATKRNSAQDLELADDAASLIATLQAFLAGMGVDRLRNTLREAQDVKCEHRSETKPPGRIFGGQMKWSDVVALTGPRPAPKPPLFDWDLKRTVFLNLVVPEQARQVIPPYTFGRRLQSLFGNIPDFSLTSNPAVKRVDRTPTNGWKILMAEGTMQYIPRREFEVPEMGKWMPEPMRSPSLASVVVYGVPEDLDERHVATCLVQGSEELVKPEDRERFRQLRVRRLLA